jgi:hypothetical protein
MKAWQSKLSETDYERLEALMDLRYQSGEVKTFIQDGITALGYSIISLNGGDLMPTLEEIRQNILPFVDEYGIKRVGVFGSLARGEATESSDIDLYMSQ